MSIPVAIIIDGGDSRLVGSYFSNSVFNVFTVSGKADMTPLEYEKHVVRSALLEAKEKSPDEYSILIKDTSTSSFTPEELAYFIQESRVGNIVYLTRWGDRCDLLKGEVTLTYGQGESTSSVTRYVSVSPKGFQAIMVSPTLRDMILSKDFPYMVHLDLILTETIQKGLLVAHVFVPDLVLYDAITYATENNQFMRMNKCENVQLPPSQPEIGAETYFYMTAIISFFIVAAWGMYLLGPKPKNKKN